MKLSEYDRNRREAALWYCLVTRYQIEQREEDRKAKQNPADPTYEPENISNHIGMFKRCHSIVAEPQTTEAQHRLTEQHYWRLSLRTQRNLNRITFWAALVAALVGLGGFWILKRTLDTTRTQAGTAQTQLHISDRPWLGVAQDSRFDVTFTYGPVAWATIQLAVKNFGQSVALHAKVVLTIADRQDELDAGAPRICELAQPEELPIKITKWGYAVFPGVTFMRHEEIGLARDTKLFNEKAPIHRVWVFGCVVYDDQFLRPHWTRFCYESAPKGDWTADVSKTGISGFQLYERYNDTDTEPEPK